MAKIRPLSRARHDLQALRRELYLLERAIDGMHASGETDPDDFPALSSQVGRCHGLVRDVMQALSKDKRDAS